jgi:hydroxymethylglutaryl-CoA lyase
MMAERVEIVEVAPRDGFQSLAAFVPTEAKIALLHKLHEAGLRRVEATSFVSAAALPQFADAGEVLAAAYELDGMDPQVLVPTARHAERALEAGARHIAFVVSVSEAHNRSNVRRSPLESVGEYRSIAAMLPEGARIRLNLATAFDCPFGGTVGEAQVLELLGLLTGAGAPAEIALCDTTGRVTPARVEQLFAAARSSIGAATWAFHGHDTYGLGAANAFAAWRAGVRVFDSSLAGLGGCPYAPGATGNVATEDLVWMFDGMGVRSGVDLQRLVAAARGVTRLPGATTGGRVRDALASRVDP